METGNPKTRISTGFSRYFLRFVLHEEYKEIVWWPSVKNVDPP